MELFAEIVFTADSRQVFLEKPPSYMIQKTPLIFAFVLLYFTMFDFRITDSTHIFSVSNLVWRETLIVRLCLYQFCLQIHIHIAAIQSRFYAYYLIPDRFSKDLSFPPLCYGFLTISTNSTVKSLGAKICLYLRLHMEINMPKNLHHNTFYVLRYAHVRYIKCLFTNIRKQKKMIRISLIWKKFRNFTHK